MIYLYVGRMGTVDKEVAAAVAGRLASEFDLPVREMELPEPDFAYDAGRRQYASIAVLERLVRAFPADAVKLVALTERDLFIPVLTFVFGHAQLNGRVAAVSLARFQQELYRMPENREVFLARALKEALHETGHTFGLVHCADGSCAMSLATNVRQIDSKNDAFCASCAHVLRRSRRVNQ